MKKKVLISAASMLFGLLISTNAQMHDNLQDSTHGPQMHKFMRHKNHPGSFLEKSTSMKKNKINYQGLERRMQSKLMMPYLMIVKKLPGMLKELNLSDEQVSRLVDLQASFEKQKTDHKADLIKKELKLKSSLKASASSKEISDQLTSCAAVKVNIAVAAYDTFNKMKSVLNDTQKKKIEEFFEKHDKIGNCSKEEL
jgi:hypothetical protein